MVPQILYRRAYVLQESSSKLVVVVIYGESDFVAAATPEDTKWTPIIDATDVGDVAYCPTLGLTLFVQGSGFVSYCDLHQLLLVVSNNNKSPLRLVDYASPSKQISKLGNPKICRAITEKFYLLESFGDILMVKRTYDQDTVMTDGFQVYKLDLQTKQWKSPATSVKASSFPSSCNPNSIYFNDDGREACYWYNDSGQMIDFVQGGRDMGAWDFANSTVQPFYHGHDYLSYYSVPIWLMPQL
ncbi:hypothetical protein RDABS01_037577 [Bienertia sinuspersici]